MKKVMTTTVLLALLAFVSTAYACGEKSGSKADASQSKAELTVSADVTVAPAVVTTEEDVSVTKADYSGCCPGKAGVKAEQAVVKTAGSEKYNCPASASCPTPCNEDVKDSAAKSSSASVKSDVESGKAISTSAEVPADAGTLK